MGNRLVHCKKSAYDVYIGRPSKWGNPFSHQPLPNTVQVASRLKAIDAYEDWIRNGEGRHLLNDLHELEGKTIACWCHPQPCHGNVLLKLLEERASSINVNEHEGVFHK